MRLDNYLVEREVFCSRTKAKQAIERGEIYVDGKQIFKVSYELSENFSGNVEYRYLEKYVSLGGYKLKKALVDFDFSVENFIVADIGASTGGFTDCLLNCGAKQVFAVDLNDGLLHESLKNDDRVISIIKNAKDLVLSDFSSRPDLFVADLSFISITQIFPVFSRLVEKGKNLIVLVKPQFETGEKRKFKNGIIKDKNVHKVVCDSVLSCAIENGFLHMKTTTAPIVANKNLEFLMLFEKK